MTGVRRRRLTRVLDRAPVLFRACHNFRDIGRHSVCVRTVETIQFFDGVEVLQFGAIKNQVVRTVRLQPVSWLTHQAAGQRRKPTPRQKLSSDIGFPSARTSNRHGFQSGFGVRFEYYNGNSLAGRIGRQFARAADTFSSGEYHNKTKHELDWLTC
jgi:hypothetical protein